MRILVVGRHFPKPGIPAGIWALEQAKALQGLGHVVKVIVPVTYVPGFLAATERLKKWASVPKSLIFDGVRVYYVRDPYYPTQWTLQWLYTPFPELELVPTWLRMRPVITKIVDEDEIEVLHCHHPMVGGHIGLKTWQHYGIPYVVTEHSFHQLALAGQSKRRGALYTRVLKHASHIIAVSSRLAREMRAWADERSIPVIPNGVDLQKVEQVTNSPAMDREDGKLILSVGSLIPRKGHRYLVEAISKLRGDLRCVIIGEGPQRPDLEEQIRREGLEDKVFLLGLRLHIDVLQLMRRSDVFVLPSWDEPFATVFPEAMAFGKPVIACAGEGTDDVIENGVNGVLVPPRDSETLADALQQILSDQDWASRMGSAARTLVEEKLTWDGNAREIEKLLQSAINA